MRGGGLSHGLMVSPPAGLDLEAAFARFALLAGRRGRGDRESRASSDERQRGDEFDDVAVHGVSGPIFPCSGCTCREVFSLLRPPSGHSARIPRGSSPLWISFRRPSHSHPRHAAAGGGWSSSWPRSAWCSAWPAPTSRSRTTPWARA